MLVTIGQPGDSEDDPTILWPNNRKEVRAGTLTLWSAMPDPKAGSYKINFDPLMMADGIEATNDPNLSYKDWKSTRLNSSHQIISYAVFCLKKKKYTHSE